MGGYSLPLWREDRLLFLVLLATTVLSSWLWWVPIRCIAEGRPFEWANEFGTGLLRGAGMGGDFLVLLLLSAMLVSIVFMGWRGARAPFKPLLVLWTSVNFASTMIIVLNDPSQYRFRGDTFGIDINMAWFMPFLKGALVAAALWWVVRDTLSPRSRTIPAWEPRNSRLLAWVLVIVPFQVALLRMGPVHGATDKAGWILTYVAWILVVLAFLPWVRTDIVREPSPRRADSLTIW